MTEVRVSADALAASVADKSGIRSREGAERVLRATVHVLGQRLALDEVPAVAACLPHSLARVIEGAGYDADFDAAEFYQRVHERLHRMRRLPGGPHEPLTSEERSSLGFAREHAQVALGVIGHELTDDVLTRLVRILPPEIGELLRAREFGAPPAYAERRPDGAPPPVHSLAAGRPGSRHPLSEAEPGLAQRHSVVREQNPHAETKLSSAHGLTQERLGRALAAGRGGPDRPISETHDEVESGEVSSDEPRDERIRHERRGAPWVP